MKKFLLLLIVSLFLVGCGDDPPQSQPAAQTSTAPTSTPTEKPKVVVPEKVSISQADFQAYKAAIFKGTESVDGHWDAIWRPVMTGLSSGSVDAQTAFTALKQLENQLINDEMIFFNAPIPNNVLPEQLKTMQKINSGFQTWVQSRRKASEYFRQNILMKGNFTTESMAACAKMISEGDKLLTATQVLFVAFEKELQK